MGDGGCEEGGVGVEEEFVEGSLSDARGTGDDYGPFIGGWLGG